VADHLDILYNVTGQEVYLDAPEGRPSSVTSVTVYGMSTGDDGTTESALGSPSVESNPDTTFDALSGEGTSDPTICNLASITGINVSDGVNRQPYLASNDSGQSEWVEVVETGTGLVKTRHPLLNSYGVGGSFESVRITATVDSTWVADTTNLTDDLDPNPGYRVRWVYVVDSVSYVRDAYFDLVRYKGLHSVRAKDIDNLSPGWLDSLPPEHIADRGAALVDTAYEDLTFDLMESDIPDEMLRNRDVVNQLVIRKAIALAEEAKIFGGGGSIQAYEIAMDRYQGRLNKLIKITNRTATATNTYGGGERPTGTSMWGK